MATMTRNELPVAHVRYNGRSVDVPLGSLMLPVGASDVQFKVALANWLDVPARNFNDYVLDRHPNGNAGSHTHTDGYSDANAESAAIDSGGQWTDGYPGCGYGCNAAFEGSVPGH